MRRRPRRRYRSDCMPGIAIAFGLGLFLALFGSVKLALIIAAIALICFGSCFRS